MAKVTLKNLNNRQFGGFSPFGNVTSLKFRMATGALGAVQESDSTTPLANGDVVDLGHLPEGFSLEDASVFVTTGMSATIKGKLGFVYEDGEDSTEVPQDSAYFGSNMAMDAAARIRASGAKLVTLPKPARLVLTISGADNAKASEVAVVVNGELTGPR